jgi:hypothetical protein
MPFAVPQLRMKITIGISTLLLAALAAPQARADRRSLIRAYEYATQPEGNLEFELWNDVDAPSAGGFSAAPITTRVELEYGLTDHWDVALYHVFEQAPGEPFHFDSWRLETRYRLFEKNVLPVDIMLYLEGERPADLAAPWEVEEKLILERDIGPRFALVFNLVGEQKLFHANEGHAWEIDAGARYEIIPQLRVAAEYWTIHDSVEGTFDYMGPSVSWASSRVWVQLGAGFGVGDSSGATFVRSVLGFNL